MKTKTINEILNNELNSTNKLTREIISKAALEDDLFIPVYDISMRNQKDLAYKRLMKLLSLKTVSVRDFLKDPENIFVTHEMVDFKF